MGVKTLKEVEAIVCSRGGGSGGGSGSAEACLQAAREHLHGGAYQQQEIEQVVGQSLEDLFQGSAASTR